MFAMEETQNKLQTGTAKWHSGHKNGVRGKKGDRFISSIRERKRVRS
ncbi:MAG: hypothetical protein J7L16_08515 [Deltaproteobacteria bacterium]|nr:hypothetical protein [Deltaproteobacteria bacterium]